MKLAKEMAAIALAFLFFCGVSGCERIDREGNNHPHVVQGVECYNGKIICYSLGNFCFGASHHPYDMETMVYQQTFTFIDGELQPYIDASVIPARVSSTTEFNDFQPVYLEGEEKSAMLERINTYCEPYGYARFDEDGKLFFTEAVEISEDEKQETIEY